ncbi:DUF2155 domain-containing protein [Pelagivirga sediminicola]|uniref:DUF2155 domain-containing protein n=1 Tax=Pelagivirga sediminicola TaxID=2170575 RepID=A0A2T7G7Q9_9RHOB|nr:DUF2155 domain-containing protein [Pelagivirga sediminicola]PVA10453.1 DUF2155 domain-containing protein [Pelagivirga sediminicola]
MRAAALLLALLATFAAAAQDGATVGTGAELRALEKVSGKTTDFTLAPGETAKFGRMTIEMAECRYPVGDPAADAFAYLIIREDGADAAQFAGWMIASSPALNALDHPRYDVWVLRCKTE